MLVGSVLETIKNTRGTKDKMQLLREHDTPVLRKALKYAMDGFINFHVVKYQKSKNAIMKSLVLKSLGLSFLRLLKCA